MAKNCQNSKFGGKSRHICANLAIFSLFTGVTSLLITFSSLQDKNLPIYFICQKFQFESKEEPGVIYYACKVIQTTDKDLKQFIGKALVQKVSAKHQAFTKPDDVISFMLGNKVSDVNQ